MDNMNKPHDWFATRFLNPDKTPEFLVLEGFSTENTKIEDKDFYKNKAKVKEFFTDENGVFDEKSFDKAYNDYTQEYQYLSGINNRDFVLQFYEKHPGVFSVPFGHSYVPKMEITKVANPLDQSFGITAINEWSEPTISAREAAQKNRIWNSETQTWSEKSLNDYGALGILDKSLIYATDEEGNWKMDDFGNYYTETVGSKENLDKTFVTISEVLTEDGSMMNKVDIFDSDNRESDLLKTAIRSAIIVGSTFTPVGSAIIYSTAALEFLKSLPGIAKMVNGFINDSESETLNSWDNYMKKFSISQSDESLQKGFWSAENILTMMQDSFMQLTQQRAIAMLPNKLMGAGKKSEMLMEAARQEAGAAMVFGGAGANAAVKMSKSFNDAEKLLREASKVSDQISKVYLVTTAMQDVFNQSRRHGFDQETSAWVTLLSSLGMYGLLQTDYFRGMLTNNMDYELKREMKTVAKSFVDTMEDAYKKAGIPTIAATTSTEAAKTNVFKTLGQKAKSFYDNHINKVSSGMISIPHGMLAEGIEETMEEVMQDSAVAITRGFKLLSATLSGKEYSDSYRWENTDPISRYLASFVGGAIGGGIFKTADLLYYKKGAYEQFTKMLTDHKQLGNKIIEYVAMGHSNELRSLFKDIKDSGLPFVDKNLSAVTLKPTQNENETVSTVTFNNIDDAIVAMDSFIRSNGLNYGREDVGKKEQAQAARAGWLMDENMTELIYQGYLSNMGELVSLDAKRTSLMNDLDGKSDDEKQKIRAEIKQYDDLIKEKTKDVKNLVEGRSDRYMGMIMLRSNPAILDTIIPTTKEAIAQHRHNTSYDALPAAFKADVDKAFEAKQKGSIHELNLAKAWDVYRTLASDEELKTLAQNIDSNLSSYRGISPENSDKIQLLKNILQSYDKFAHLTDYDFSKLVSFLYNAIEYGKTQMLKSDQDKYLTYDSEDNTALNSMREAVVSMIRVPIKVVDKDGKEVDDYGVLDLTNNSLVKAVRDILNAVRSNVDADPEYLSKLANKKERSEQENMELKLSEKYGTLEDFDILVAELQTWINKLNDIDWITTFIEDMVEDYDDSPVLEMISSLMAKQFDLKNFNLLEFIESENNAIENLGQNYRLSPESEKIIEQLQRVITLMDSLLTGASRERVTFVGQTVPVGANNVLNEGFRENKVNLDLMEISGYAAVAANTTMSGIMTKIKDIVDAHLRNSGAVISRDKRASIKRSNALIKQLKDAFEKNIFVGLFIDVPELEEARITGKESDEELLELGVKLRNQLRNFEQKFSEEFAQLDSASKTDLIKSLRDTYNNDLADTTAIQNDEDKINVSDADLYWYLCSCTAINPNNFDAKYLAWVKENSELCPFDSQEDVVLQAARMISLPSDDLNMWLATKKGDRRPVLNSVVKIFGLGGVGKTSALIPLVVYLSGKSVSMLTNNTSQQENLRKAFGDSIEISLIEDFSKNYESEIQKFSSGKAEHIIIVDEATNIYSHRDESSEKNDLSKWNKAINDCGDKVKIVAFGDHTQCGVNPNAYHTISAMTRQLDESIRAQLDILRVNIQTAKGAFGVSETGNETVDNSKRMTMNYYETDTEFYGHKFIDITPEEDSSEQDFLYNLTKNFVSKYGTAPDGTNHSFLIYTTDKILREKISKEFTGRSGINFASSAKEAQGAEWDYVLVLDTFRFKDTDKKITKEFNTLVSRPKLGFVSPKIKNGWVINNIAQDRPPVSVGLDPEEVKSFKGWKLKMLEQVKLSVSEDSGGSGSTGGGMSLSPVSMDVPTSHDSNARVTPSFIPKTDFDSTFWQSLGYSSIDDYLHDRMVLYTALTTRTTDAARQSFLQEHLTNKTLVNTHQFALEIRTGDKIDDMYDVGNVRDQRKFIEPTHRHAWVVFIDPSKPNTKIHLGMFFTEVGTREAGLPDSQFTNSLHTQPVGLYKIPKDWKIHRDRNPLHIRPDRMKSGESKQTSTQDRRGFVSQKTPAIFMSSYGGITAPTQGLIMQILKALDDQKKLYQSIFKYVENHIGLDDPIKQANYLHLRSVVQYDQHTRTFKTRGVPDLDHKFVYFVATDPTLAGTMGNLYTVLTTYLKQIENQNTLLEGVNKDLSGMSDENANTVIDEVGTKLNGSIVMDSVSAVACSPASNLMEGQEVEVYFRDVFGGDKSNYAEIVFEQVLTLLKRVHYIAELKSWKADSGFTTEDYNVVKKWWNDLDNSDKNELITRLANPESLKEWLPTIPSLIADLYTGETSIASRISKLNAYFKSDKVKHAKVPGVTMAKEDYETWVYPQLIADSGETINDLTRVIVAQNEHGDSDSVIQLAQIQVFRTGDTLKLEKLDPTTPSPTPSPSPSPTPIPGPGPGPRPEPEPGGGEIDIQDSDDRTITDAVIGLFDSAFAAQVREVIEESLLPSLSESTKSELASMPDLGVRLEEQLGLERKDRDTLFRTIVSEISKMQKNIC